MYAAKVCPTDCGVEIEPLPLDHVKGARARDIDAEMAFEIGRAVGYYGYTFDPALARELGPSPSPIEVLQPGGRLPLSVGPDGVLIPKNGQAVPRHHNETSCEGALKCVSGPDGTGCQCVHAE